MSVKLDVNMAMERCKQNGEKLPHEKTDGEWWQSERNKEERKSPKHKAREKSRTGNTINSTTKLDATKTELAIKPAVKKAIDETEKICMIRIAPIC